jgi:hypothetical protein
VQLAHQVAGGQFVKLPLPKPADLRVGATSPRIGGLLRGLFARYVAF